jgi:hypothetical protein
MPKKLHGVDTCGQVIILRQLKRRYVLAVLPEGATMPCRNRSLRLVAPLVASDFRFS